MAVFESELMEDRVSQLSLLNRKMRDLAIGKMYNDLMTGEYNAQYLQRAKDTQGLPSHFVDKLVDGQLSDRQTCFSVIANKLEGNVSAHFGAFEKHLYELCTLKKHYFVREYMQVKGLNSDRIKTSKIIKKVFQHMI